jgi:hypothetical protein
MESASMEQATVFSYGRVIDDPWSFLVVANLFISLKGKNLFLFCNKPMLIILLYLQQLP